MARPPRPDGVTGVLDIGTSKIVCLIGRYEYARATDPLDPAAGLRILGLGHQRAAGIAAGAIADLEQAEHAIRATLAQAERMAGVTIDKLFVSVSCGRLKSHSFSASAEISGGRVSAADVARMMAGSRAYVERDGRSLVHLNCKLMQLDGVPSEGSPVGLAATSLSADVHAVSADRAPLRNMEVVLERCHVGIQGFSVAGHASALAVTSDAERRLGTTVVDIGSGTSKLATYSGGQLVRTASISQGSGSITAGIARALHTPLIEAERIKALYGNLLSARSDDREEFSYAEAGSGEGLAQRTTRAQLVSVIRPIVAELLLAVAGSNGPATGTASETLVLTGGGAQLPGLAEFASRVLQRPVRMGQAVAVSGLPPIARTPPFATATGLLFASNSDDFPVLASIEPGDAVNGTYLQRVGAWLKSGF